MSLFDSAMSLHAKALTVRSQRVEVLARNIANADTPHYKAKDVDFKAMLQQASSTDTLQTTHRQHQAQAPEPVGGPAGELYRIPFNVSFDGNTVELNVEQAQYGKAAADYQAALNFFQNDVSGLRKAMRGD